MAKIRMPRHMVFVWDGDGERVVRVAIFTKITIQDPVFAGETRNRIYSVEVDDLDPTKPVEAAILAFVQDLETKVVSVLNRTETMTDGS